MKKKNKKKNTVVFDYKNIKGFYEKPLVLPAAAHWNMDEVLMSYIAAGLQALLDGPVDWNYNNEFTTGKMERAIKLAQEYVEAATDIKELDTSYRSKANECLRLLIEIDASRLGD